MSDDFFPGFGFGVLGIVLIVLVCIFSRSCMKNEIVDDCNAQGSFRYFDKAYKCEKSPPANTSEQGNG